MHRRFTRRASRDVAEILTQTLEAFGTRQVRVYADLIDRAVAMIADDPSRPSARSRPELGTGVRSFHVALASGRRGGAAHVVYFAITTASDGADELIVLRVLHEGMEPRSGLD